MSRSIPLTRAALQPQASHFRSFERLLELELSGLTGGSRYELNFSRLMKPDPFRLFGVDSGPDLPFMLGTDQRDHVVPLIAGRLAGLPPGAMLLDIGSGDGQTTAAALESRADPLTLIPLDPAEGALQRYRDFFSSHYPQFSVPRTVAAGIDELLAAAPGSAAAVDGPLDMILAIHALYFTADHAGFLRFAHDRLRSGGKLLIVFAECDGRFSGRLAREYRARYPAPGDRRHHTGGDDLDRFFGVPGANAGREACEAALRDRLGGELFHVADVVRQPTRLFGHDLGDIIACGFLTSLAPADDTELRQQIHFVSSRLQEAPEVFDLRLTVSGPRARMLSVAQPQIFIDLEKR